MMSLYPLLMVLFLMVPALAACEPEPPNVDEMLETAQDKAFNGAHKEARAIARKILKITPDYHDATILIGRTLAWEGQFRAARSQFMKVLEQEPDYVDAYSALIDTELWSKNPTAALRAANRGLEQATGNEVLLYKKAEALAALGRRDAAIEILEALLESDSGNDQAEELLAKLRAGPASTAQESGE